MRSRKKVSQLSHGNLQLGVKTRNQSINLFLSIYLALSSSIHKVYICKCIYIIYSLYILFPGFEARPWCLYGCMLRTQFFLDTSDVLEVPLEGGIEEGREGVSLGSEGAG